MPEAEESQIMTVGARPRLEEMSGSSKLRASALTRFSMDDLWANPPWGSWRKVAVAWRRVHSGRDTRCRTPREARTLVVLALQDWLVAEFSKWITLVLLLATLIQGCVALSKQIGGWHLSGLHGGLAVQHVMRK